MHKLQSASEKPLFAPTGTTRLLLTIVLRMAFMGPSGSEAVVFSSESALGTTSRITFTATSIINLTIVRATAGGSQRAALLQQNIAQSFTVKQCMMYMATKHPAVTS